MSQYVNNDLIDKIMELINPENPLNNPLLTKLKPNIESLEFQFLQIESKVEVL